MEKKKKVQKFLLLSKCKSASSCAYYVEYCITNVFATSTLCISCCLNGSKIMKYITTGNKQNVIVETEEKRIFTVASFKNRKSRVIPIKTYLVISEELLYLRGFKDWSQHTFFIEN